MEMAKAGQLWIRQFASRIWQMREDFIGHSMTPLYTAEIFGKIDMERFGPYVSVDYYQLPESGKSYRLSFPEYSKFVSAEFETKEELIKNKEVSDLVCIKCRRMLRKKIRWFSYGQRFYFAMGICPEHGYMKERSG